jgi:hypothetical protein
MQSSNSYCWQISAPEAETPQETQEIAAGAMRREFQLIRPGDCLNVIFNKTHTVSCEKIICFAQKVPLLGDVRKVVPLHSISNLSRHSKF